jgi:hypothetical protein
VASTLSEDNYTTIQKPPVATEYADYRAISLICHTSKTVLMILNKRIADDEVVKGIEDLQIGSRKRKVD